MKDVDQIFFRWNLLSSWDFCTFFHLEFIFLASFLSRQSKRYMKRMRKIRKKNKKWGKSSMISLYSAFYLSRLAHSLSIVITITREDWLSTRRIRKTSSFTLNSWHCFKHARCHCFVLRVRKLLWQFYGTTVQIKLTL